MRGPARPPGERWEASIPSPFATLRSNRCREHETYARLDPRALRALVAVLGRGVTRRRRLGFIRAAARPHTALQPPSKHATAGTPTHHCNAAHGWAAARIKHRRPRWTVLRPARLRERAQHADRAARTLSCSRHLSEPQRSGGELCRAGRKTVQRGESGERCEAPLPDVVAIAPRPSHARRCREVAERSSPKAPGTSPGIRRRTKKTATLRWLYKVLGRTSLGDLKPFRALRMGCV